jgi:transposase
MARKGKRKQRRKYTVDEKVRILEEARAPDTTVAEVLRRHQVDQATFYRWEKQAKQGAREGLEGRRARNGKAAEREIERLEQELEQKRRIIAEVVQENLELRRGL